jgi:hypothetical protein
MFENPKEKLVLLIKFFLRALCYTLIIISAYTALIYIFTPGNLLFYKGIVALLAVTSILLAILFIAFPFKIFEKHIGALFLALLISYSFHVTLPVILDRSVSVHILNFIDTQKSTEFYEVRNNFMSEYIRGNGAICRRIYEQSETGNVAIDENDQIHITKRGKLAMYIFSLLIRIYGVNDHAIIDDNACSNTFNKPLPECKHLDC